MSQSNANLLCTTERKIGSMMMISSLHRVNKASDQQRNP
jgi:hypothetical protein